jgi:hypothetical protein
VLLEEPTARRNRLLLGSAQVSDAQMQAAFEYG